MFDMDALMAALSTVLALDTVLFILIGVAVGISVGAIPGLGHSLPIALVLPFSFFLPFHQTMGLLIGTYKGGTFGGSITAISFGTPGVSGSAATVADGYALTKQGKGKKALQMGLYSSITGDMFSDLVLIFLVVPIGALAPRFGPAELTALYIFALSLVVGFSAKSPGRGLFSAGVGFFLSIIGRDIITGSLRFTFGVRGLEAGIPLVPLLIGFFAIPEMVRQIGLYFKMKQVKQEQDISEKVKKKEEGLTLKEFFGSFRGLGLGSILGTFLGALPGPGATLSSYTAYSIAGQFSKDKNYGKGSLEGVAAAESANNATCGATFIPMLTFGIPGSSIAALLMAALIFEGIPMGPRVVIDHTQIVYTLFLLLLLANPMNLIGGHILIPLYSKLTKVAPQNLWAIIGVIVILGTYALNLRPFDITVAIGAGLLGCFFYWFRIPDGPLILSFLVGPLFEANFRRTLTIARGDISFFFSSNIALVLWILTFAAIVFMIRSSRRRSD